jgi:hypothetical protein
VARLAGRNSDTGRERMANSIRRLASCDDLAVVLLELRLVLATSGTCGWACVSRGWGRRRARLKNTHRAGHGTILPGPRVP